MFCFEGGQRKSSLEARVEVLLKFFYGLLVVSKKALKEKLKYSLTAMIKKRGAFHISPRGQLLIHSYFFLPE